MVHALVLTFSEGKRGDLCANPLRASEHPADVKAFQDAIREGADFALTHVEESRAIIGKYSKLPPPIMALVRLPPALETNVTASQLSWWFDVMKQQGLVENKVDFEKVILK